MVTTSIRARPRTLVLRGRGTAAAAWRLARSGDVAWTYAGVVLVVTVVLVLLGPHDYDRVVSASSTNLANLRDRPWAVLLTSAFVLSNPAGLYILPFLVLGYAAAQRWVGRTGVLVVAAVGHVGATLVVATVLIASIAHGTIEPHAIAHVTDVGVSYALSAVLVFVVGRVPRRWRIPYLVVTVGWFVGPAVFGVTFTDVGHAVAMTIGGLLALLASRAAAAAGAVAPGPTDSTGSTDTD